MLGIAATDNPDDSSSPDDPAVLTDRLDATPNLHLSCPLSISSIACNDSERAFSLQGITRLAHAHHAGVSARVAVRILGFPEVTAMVCSK